MAQTGKTRCTLHYFKKVQSSQFPEFGPLLNLRVLVDYLALLEVEALHGVRFRQLDEGLVKTRRVVDVRFQSH